MRRQTSVKISSESEWVYETKKERPWYAKGVTGILGLIVLAIVDISGFIQGVLTKAVVFDSMAPNEALFSKVALGVMVAGFIAAFEGSTIYMAYAFTLKLYHYDRYAIKRINKKGKSTNLSKFVSTSALGWISFIAFILGIIANIIFRMGLMNGKVFFNPPYHITYDGAITVVMIILPVVTSVLNFVVGCFTFDPLLFELDGLAKRIAKIDGNISLLKLQENSVEKILSNIDLMKKSEKKLLNSNKAYVTSLRPSLRTRIYDDVI